MASDSEGFCSRSGFVAIAEGCAMFLVLKIVVSDQDMCFAIQDVLYLLTFRVDINLLICILRGIKHFTISVIHIPMFQDPFGVDYHDGNNTKPEVSSVIVLMGPDRALIELVLRDRE